MHHLRINRKRLLNDLESLSQIGTTGDGGVHRIALSEAHLDARSWLIGKFEEAGLKVTIDAAGNHSGLLKSRHADARTLLIGSHLDSVPYGGRFDGALGVLTALEVVRTIKEANIHLNVDLEVIDFTDEEGTLVGLMGSRAVAGTLASSDLENPRGGRDALLAGFERAGIQDPLQATRRSDDFAGFLEIHIEQGNRLTGAGIDIGIVSALVGIGSFSLTFLGRADHAGTTPMNARRDAGAGAAAFMTDGTRLISKEFADSVVNFGKVNFLPGSYNIVPAAAEVGVEFRAGAQNTLDEMEARLLELARKTASAFDLEYKVEKLGYLPPAHCAPEILESFESSCGALGLSYIRLLSGAGHDTQAMADVCPSGMIFIPSFNGSHNPKEFAEDDAIENGANVILQTVLLGWGRI